MKTNINRNAETLRQIFSSNDNSDENNAFSKGYNDYLNGNRKNPYKYGTTEYNGWWEGYWESVDDCED